MLILKKNAALKEKELSILSYYIKSAALYSALISSLKEIKKLFLNKVHHSVCKFTKKRLSQKLFKKVFK